MHPSASVLSRFGFRFAVLGVVAVSASACSSTDRFAYDPFANPFNGSKTASNERGPSTTGSLADSSGPISRAPTSKVSSEPLPPPSSYGSASSNYGSPSPSPAYAPGAPSYAQAPAPSYPAAPSYPSAPARQDYAANSYPSAPAKSFGQGGRTVVVQYGDTPYSLGQRHGVPASKILSANKLPQGSTLSPGQRIVIPSSANQTAANDVMTPAPRIPSRAAGGRSGSHTVAAGETLFSVARQYGVPAGQLASANGYDLSHRVRVGETLTLPTGTSASTATASAAGRKLGAPPAALGATRAEEPAPVVAQAPVEAAPAPVRAAPPAQVATPAASEEPKFQRAVASTEAKPVTKTDDADDAPKSASASAGADFRWPVRGRVISGFGSKPNGTTNDGLNLSVPEGTAIKAAEGGVVAYAGNELKGFGNLVLIRHQGEWVTAYAHASEILVKRGDVVRRGQVIAKSGKTGNVSAPQLHFEVRRGATPVDPMGQLPAG
jgi:murein DD-endopeptidase MepM/ murein hydrolase activator NlpD